MIIFEEADNYTAHYHHQHEVLQDDSNARIGSSTVRMNRTKTMCQLVNFQRHKNIINY
jgi:hypothetical protein